MHGKVENTVINRVFIMVAFISACVMSFTMFHHDYGIWLNTITRALVIAAFEMSDFRNDSKLSVHVII